MQIYVFVWFLTLSLLLYIIIYNFQVSARSFSSAKQFFLRLIHAAAKARGLPWSMYSPFPSVFLSIWAGCCSDVLLSHSLIHPHRKTNFFRCTYEKRSHVRSRRIIACKMGKPIRFTSRSTTSRSLPYRYTSAVLRQFKYFQGREKISVLSRALKTHFFKFKGFEWAVHTVWMYQL